MRAFLATVLSVIAVGVVLIAYGLLSPRVAASDVYPSDSARPAYASQQIGYVDDLRDPRAVRSLRFNPSGSAGRSCPPVPWQPRVEARDDRRVACRRRGGARRKDRAVRRRDAEDEHSCLRARVEGLHSDHGEARSVAIEI